MNSAAYDAPDPRDYLRLIWRRGWILLVCVIVLPLAAYEYTATKPKVFQSSTVIQVQASEDSSALTGTDVAPAQSNIELVAAYVSTSAVADEAARRLGLPGGSLRGSAQASSDPDTGFVTITATGPTAKRAAEIADAFAAALNATRAEQALQRINAAIQTVQQTLKNTPKTDGNTRSQLATQLQRLETLRQAQGSNSRVIEPAGPGAQIAPKPKRNATVALVLALLVAAGLIALAERMDRRLHKPEELERLTGLPFLATIPHEAFPGKDKAASNEVHESFQTLRSSLTYFNVDEPVRSLLVASALKGEGKTTVATNLAKSYAEAGKRVILVDADLRKPDTAQQLGVNEPIGLSQVIAGVASVADALREVEPYGHALRVLPAGAVPPNASALLGSLRMKSLISELGEDADLVLVDSTPLLAVSDAFPLLDKVSGIVVLARLDTTRKDAIARTLQIIENAGGRVLGVVATDGKNKLRGGYGYGYGYGTYGYGDGAKKRADAAPSNGAAPDVPAQVQES